MFFVNVSRFCVRVFFMSSLLSGLLMDQHDCTRGKIYVLKTEIPNKTKAKKKKNQNFKMKKHGNVTHQNRKRRKMAPNKSSFSKSVRKLK